MKRQNEGSGTRKQKSSGERQRAYSNSRERVAANQAAQGKSQPRAQKPTTSNALASSEQKNARPPLAGNPSSISKSQRKKPLPHFIQTHSHGMALAISPKPQESAPKIKKESSSTRASQLPLMQSGHQHDLAASKYQQSSAVKSGNAAGNHSGEPQRSAVAKRSSTAYYETPDKSSMPLNHKLDRQNENIHHNLRQRMRSSC